AGFDHHSSCNVLKSKRIDESSEGNCRGFKVSRLQLQDCLRTPRNGSAMMTPNKEAQYKAATTYNAAADHYDAPSNTFWDRYGRSTVERLNLASGSRVLDVCCGAGASAIPAASIVGPNGLVVGIDLAENLLE